MRFYKDIIIRTYHLIFFILNCSVGTLEGPSDCKEIKPANP